MAKLPDNRNIRVLQFLDAYEKQESLWNPSLESYKNKQCRDDAYMRIIKELNVPNLSIGDIKLKVKSIRTTYTKELRMLTKHKDEGKPYTPKLFWFHRANTFLKNVSLSREKRPPGYQMKCEKVCGNADDFLSISKEEDTSLQGTSVDIINREPQTPNTYDFKTLEAQIDTNMDVADESVETAATSIIDNTAKQSEDYTAFNANENSRTPAINAATSNLSIIPSISSNPQNPSAVVTTVNQTINSTEDEYDLFCRSVAAQLRAITDNYSRSVAKLKIQQILFEAETGHYRNSTCITMPISQSVSSL